MLLTGLIMTPIDDLIGRLEAATEGSHELDGAIYRYLHPKRCEQYADDREIRHAWTCPQWTTSLDAALTLVGDKWWTVGPGKTREAEPLYGAAIYEPIVGEPQLIASGETNANPALALCIAALKARFKQA